MKYLDTSYMPVSFFARLIFLLWFYIFNRRSLFLLRWSCMRYFLYSYDYLCFQIWASQLCWGWRKSHQRTDSSVTFVWKLLKIIIVLSTMNAFILERNHFSVTFVKSHLLKKVLLQNIKEFILVKNFLNVIFVDINFLVFFSKVTS